MRGTEEKKHHQVYHGISYEGWSKNGERVSLVNPHVMLITSGVNDFWKEMQASSAHRYSLENTQIVTNSDNDYHIKQAINRAFGWNKSEFKSNIQSAITNKDKNKFILWTDTFESRLE